MLDHRVKHPFDPVASPEQVIMESVVNVFRIPGEIQPHFSLCSLSLSVDKLAFEP